MNFHHLAYWQDKALSLAIENRLFINGEYTAAAENETFETVGNDSNLLIVFYVQIMPDDFVMQLHRF